MSLETLISSLTAATTDEDVPLRPTLYSLDDPAQRGPWVRCWSAAKWPPSGTLWPSRWRSC
ncbi:hypothetical protein [Streptomyces sp. XY332]|uniref:hypothetical protein n=1 Tax=Streptomyces sp. XY332 TaxID=1415561 RepID=UPI00131E6074|nr:hypothetical protein [Streptomyces sp. XY332]